MNGHILFSVCFGNVRLIPRNDDFNFQASQCRTRIEMAFGLMQTNWSILCQPQSCLLKSLKHQVHAVACLNNFAINERLGRLGRSTKEAPSTLSCLTSKPQDEDGNPVLLDGLSRIFLGCSELREEWLGILRRWADKFGAALCLLLADLDPFV